ncbi:MAG: DUF5615 family PIN-like protein [Ignavibacteriae bacterium]|nr:DUF5615 family PIN-like protein [Ignavibacteriota bacterium]
MNEYLRELGLDTLHTSEINLQRASDPEILRFATMQNRTLVTRDADFGDNILGGSKNTKQYRISNKE